MKNIKMFESFKIDEAQTLFGASVADKLVAVKKFAELQNWKTEKSRASSKGEIPKEVRELWDKNINAEHEQGVYKLDSLRVWGKLGDEAGFNDLRDLLKSISVLVIGKEKGWETSGIKMIESFSGKKSENLAQTFSHDALGVITINVLLTKMSRNSDPNEFMVRVYSLKDEKGNQTEIDKELQSKIDAVVSGLSKSEIISVVRYLKDKHTNYTDI